jgi:hypothetical protein
MMGTIRPQKTTTKSNNTDRRGLDRGFGGIFTGFITGFAGPRNVGPEQKRPGKPGRSGDHTEVALNGSTNA